MQMMLCLPSACTAAPLLSTDRVNTVHHQITHQRQGDTWTRLQSATCATMQQAKKLEATQHAGAAQRHSQKEGQLTCSMMLLSVRGMRLLFTCTAEHAAQEKSTIPTQLCSASLAGTQTPYHVHHSLAHSQQKGSSPELQ